MKTVPVIVGPTAAGKTKLSLIVASRIKSEIISADSRQIYRYMDIGTAKPTKMERKLIRHHFIDIRNPDETYSSGEFAQEARQKIAELLAQNICPIVVGGAGFYIRALVDGLMAPKITDASVRAHLQKQLEQEGIASLYQRLQEVDREAALNIKANDRHRILRALEVFEITGKPFSAYATRKPDPGNFTPRFWGVRGNRIWLHSRIENRVDKMLESGLIEEVEMIRKKGYSKELPALQTVGYKEVFDFLDDRIKRGEMVELIKRNSRRYAKRQLTWFNADKRISWFDVDSTSFNFELFGKEIVNSM
ncbi:tRNA (adenosine(37)-N6)-dimethylallyltransferase MiaA [candidate division KSB1 bacterium]|nr:tRNA (adenosine(37)-N6)-dimethylallyltransferase MiaA [candidate division KSB1 bacterium]